ncbi:hypothetical protein [Stagnimonas aquatica]|nr:hypothetical protein [Stagnimonas aquatica]
MNKKIGLTLMAAASLFSATAAAQLGPYLPASIGNQQPVSVAGFSAAFSFGDAVVFTLTGENSDGATLAAVPADEASVASARSAQASEGALPNGTYTFVDEDGATARVKIEDGEVTAVH